MEKVVENPTRQRLIERAAHHIELKGYFGTGINEILKETGIPKGSLYHHFPGGKDELIKEAIKYSSKKQQKAFADAMLSHKTVVDGLKAVIDYLINLLKATDFQYACPIGTIALESVKADQLIRDACQLSYQKLEVNFESYLNLHGIEDAKNCARIIINMIEGGAMLAKAYSDVTHMEVIKDYLDKIIKE